jgi:hypothetical protein
VTVYWIWASAVRPSAEIALEVYGSMTAATCGAVFAWSTLASTAAWYFGSVILVPAGDSKTIWALVPAAGGSVFCSSLSAFCEDEPGSRTRC